MFRHFASGYLVVDLYKVVSSAEAADIVSVTEALFIPTINPPSTVPPQKKYKTEFGLQELQGSKLICYPVKISAAESPKNICFQVFDKQLEQYRQLMKDFIKGHRR